MEYVVALDTHRNFVLAAEACGVTQPTLSAMLLKLEDELGVRLFERSHRGVLPTSVGKLVVRQARAAVREAHRVREVVKDEIGTLSGPLRIGIVPTVAPYLVPDFILHFTRLYPEVELQIEEMKSTVLYDALTKGQLDLVLATPPSAGEKLLEIPVYRERFLAYFSDQCMQNCAAAPSMMTDGLLSLEKMDLDYMWILQEGHCMNTGDFTFCMDRAGDSSQLPVPPLQSSNRSLYKAGSITTLIRIVDRNGGFTIIPEMHAELLSEAQKANVHPLAEGERAARTISVLVKSDYVRERLLNAVIDTLKLIIPARMLVPALSRGPVRLL